MNKITLTHTTAKKMLSQGMKLPFDFEVEIIPDPPPYQVYRKSFIDKINGFLASGKKIEAIKYTRKVTHMFLRDAKDFVENDEQQKRFIVGECNIPTFLKEEI